MELKVAVLVGFPKVSGVETCCFEQGLSGFPVVLVELTHCSNGGGFPILFVGLKLAVFIGFSRDSRNSKSPF